MVLGATDTPAFRQVLRGREFPGMADPDEVARQILDNLVEGPEGRVTGVASSHVAHDSQCV